jgi:hypothetical protein
MEGTTERANLRPDSRRWVRLLTGALAVLCLVATSAAPVSAEVPSALDQYTERPPRGAGGPGWNPERNGRERGGPQDRSAGVVAEDGSAADGAAPTGGGGAGASTGADGGMGPSQGTAGGERQAGEASPLGGEPTSSESLPASDFPITTAVLVALLALLAAIATRMVLAARRRSPQNPVH